MLDLEMQPIDHLQALAEQGDADAQCALGDLFAYHEGANLNPGRAMYWYRKAAEQGHVTAQWLLGAGYFNGVGVDQDVKQAEHWFRKSAEQGNADGQYGLGGYYLFKHDYKNAEQGHNDAQQMLSDVSLLTSIMLSQ
jgi:hypothetical protein